MKRISALITSILITGCSALTSTVTWQPDIAGATIVEQKTGVVLGSNVVAVEYNPRAEHVSTPGCFDINGVTAKWPSGHEVSTDPVIKLCQGYRDDYHVKVPYAGSEQQRSIDIPYAVEFNKALQQQQAAQSASNDYLMATTIMALSNNAIALQQTKNAYNQPDYIPVNTVRSTSQSSGCKSDYECGTGQKCVKAPLNSTGVCLSPVNEFGMPVPPQLPNPNSVFPNYNLTGQCQFDTDCSIGFKCDRKLKACVK